MNTPITQAEQDRLATAQGDLERQITALQEKVTTLEVGRLAATLINTFPGLGTIWCDTELDDDGLFLFVNITYDLQGNDACRNIDPLEVASAIGAHGYTEDAAQRLTGHTRLREALVAAQALLP